MMRKWLAGWVVFSSAFACLVPGVEGGEGSLRERDGLWLKLNVYHAERLANPFGDTYADTYVEVEGGGRSGVLDLYYFFDVQHILGTGDRGDSPGEFFSKVMPRLSLDVMTRSDLQWGIVNEWFLSTMFKGGNGFERYYAGVGADLSFPGVDALSLNVMTMGHHEGDSRLYYGGVVLAANWYTVVHEFQHGIVLTCQGWMDWGVANKHERKQRDGVPTEFQLFNGLFVNWSRYAVSASVKLNRHLAYRDAYTASDASYFVGAHYAF